MPQLLHTPYGAFHCWHDIIARTLAEGRFWDAQLKPFIDDADPHGWALDLGANIGFFTCYMAQHFQGVVAVEAHPETFKLLLRNTWEWGYRVHHYQTAAYDRQAKLKLAEPALMGFGVPDEINLDSTDGASSIAFVPPEVRSGVLEVNAIPIDWLLPADWRITFIKCDVQGCDLRALKGLRTTIARCRPLIVFEFEEAMSSWHGDAWQDYLDFFEELNYNVSRISDGGWDYVARPA